MKTELWTERSNQRCPPVPDACIIKIKLYTVCSGGPNEPNAGNIIILLIKLNIEHYSIYLLPLPIVNCILPID